MSAALHYVFVESNTTGTGRLAIERLVRAGHRVTFLTRRPSLYGFPNRAPAGVDVLEVETNEVDSLIVEVARLLDRTAVDAILTFSTFYVAIAAVVARRFGFRALDPVAARTCHDKTALRRVLARAGVPSPRFWIVDSLDAAVRAARETTYPCVVKPAADSGSNGVRLVDGPDDLMAHSEVLAARTINERGQAHPGHVLVEELLDGPEVSVETFTHARGHTDVAAITAKHLSARPWFVEIGHDVPAELLRPVQRATERTVLEALEVVGYDFGPAHTEVRLTPAGPVIVEINPRLAGGMIPELVHLASGLDVLGVVLAAAAGAGGAVHAPLRPTSHASASIRFITATRDGQLGDLPPLDGVRRMPLVRAAVLTAEAGALVRPARSAKDRLGYVITSGRDRRAVALAAERACQAIEQQLEQFAVVGRATLETS